MEHTFNLDPDGSNAKAHALASELEKKAVEAASNRFGWASLVFYHPTKGFKVLESSVADLHSHIWGLVRPYNYESEPVPYTWVATIVPNETEITCHVLEEPEVTALFADKSDEWGREQFTKLSEEAEKRVNTVLAAQADWLERCRPWKPGDWLGPIIGKEYGEAKYMVQAIKGDWVTLRSFNGMHTYRRKMRGGTNEPPYTIMGDEYLYRVEPPAPPETRHQPVQTEPRKRRANFGD